MNDKKIQPSVDEILSTLAGFSGTECYHRLTLLPLKATDGVAYVAESCQAFWLIDLVASHWLKLKQREPFLSVVGKKTGDSMRVVITDGNDKKLAVQIVGYTDFPLNWIEFYVDGDVIMLPSEY
jgi:hypothetical protein